MSSSRLWELAPHTEAKHRVLEKYLQAWLPIVGSWSGRILFIDGFAGPGEYERGEPGSPVVAMKSLVDHAAQHVILAEVIFIFIEKDPDRAAHLESVVDTWRPKLPDGTVPYVIQGEFGPSMTEVLDEIDRQKQQLAPTFLMIDPCGVKGMPMRVIRRFLGSPQCEVYITFMWEWVNRFLDTPQFETHLNDLFDTDAWKEASVLDAESRRNALHQLYAQQLRNAGAKHVVKFRVQNRQRHVYSIFFGTQHHRGSDRMKEAIWKIAPLGDFTVRGQDQLILGVEPDYRPLQQALVRNFRDAGWVSIEDVLKFVASDATDFSTRQVKTRVLKPMEQDGLIEADPSTRTRGGTYPSGCKLRFTGQIEEQTVLL